MRTSRTSALPYWLAPRTNALSSISVPAIRGVRERADQQGHVVVLVGVGDAEVDRHRRVERLPPGGCEVVADGEGQPVRARLEPLGPQLGDAPALVGHAGGDPDAVARGEGDADPGGG